MKKYAKNLLALLIACCMLPTASCSSDKNENSSDKTASVSTEEGEFVTDPSEPELGEYTVSSGGTKLYYDPDEFSPEIMAVLEKYFISFSHSDYQSYVECVYPDYADKMNEYLNADYGYDLKQSFANQCENLENNAGGEFNITRIKAELPEEDHSQEYFQTLNDIFGSDFYDSVKKDCDKLYDMTFFVMVESNGEESLLISEFEIVFAEKDGNFYTFG